MNPRSWRARLSAVVTVALFGTGLAGLPASRAEGFNVVCTPLPPDPAVGYSLVAADGGVFSFGVARFAGTLAADRTDRGEVVGVAPNPLGAGYSLATNVGEVFGFGAYGNRGELVRRPVPAGDVVGVAANRSGRGVWLASSSGGVFSLGDARFAGSLGSVRLNQPIVAIAATPSGNGYWLVAADGGVFSFGDAGFFGSTGALRLKRPIVAMIATPSGNGYWLVAADGGVFSFGDARFFGSTGDVALQRLIVGAAASPTGAGYWLVASDGGVFSFGDARFFGSTGATPLAAPIVAISTTPATTRCAEDPDGSGPPDLQVAVTTTHAETPADGAATFTLTVHNRGGRPAYLRAWDLSVVDSAAHTVWTPYPCLMDPAVVNGALPLPPGATLVVEASFFRPENDPCTQRQPVPPGDYHVLGRFLWCADAHTEDTRGWYCDRAGTATGARSPIQLTASPQATS